MEGAFVTEGAGVGDAVFVDGCDAREAVEVIGGAAGVLLAAKREAKNRGVLRERRGTRRRGRRGRGTGGRGASWA